MRSLASPGAIELDPGAAQPPVFNWLANIPTQKPAESAAYLNYNFVRRTTFSTRRRVAPTHLVTYTNRVYKIYEIILIHVGLAYCRCTTVQYVTYLATVGKCVSVLSKLASYLR